MLSWATRALLEFTIAIVFGERLFWLRSTRNKPKLCSAFALAKDVLVLSEAEHEQIGQNTRSARLNFSGAKVMAYFGRVAPR